MKTKMVSQGGIRSENSGKTTGGGALHDATWGLAQAGANYNLKAIWGLIRHVKLRKIINKHCIHLARKHRNKQKMKGAVSQSAIGWTFCAGLPACLPSPASPLSIKTLT